MPNGYTYLLTIHNMRNPDSYDQSAYKYIIEVSDSQEN